MNAGNTAGRYGKPKKTKKNFKETELKKVKKVSKNVTQDVVVCEKNNLYILWFFLLTNKSTSANIYLAPASESQAETCEIPIKQGRTWDLHGLQNNGK